MTDHVVAERHCESCALYSKEWGRLVDDHNELLVECVQLSATIRGMVLRNAATVGRMATAMDWAYAWKALAKRLWRRCRRLDAEVERAQDADRRNFNEAFQWKARALSAGWRDAGR